MVPEPLAFPHLPYAEALAVHAKLLAWNEAKLLAEAEELGEKRSPFCYLSEYAGLVAARPNGVTADIISRSHAVDISRKFPGICRELFLDRGKFRFPVVIFARGIISLHTLAAEHTDGASRLVVVSRNDVVEPQKQKHRPEGSWSITRWVAHDREPRYAWRPTPTRPTTREEIIDRLMALYGPRLRQRIADFLRAGHTPEKTLVHLKSSERVGDILDIRERGNHVALTLGFTEIEEVLDEPSPPGLVAVFIQEHRWGAIRWIAVDAPDAGASLPPGIIEDFVFPWGKPPVDPGDDTASDEDDEDDEEPPPKDEAPKEAAEKAPPVAETKQKRKLSTREMVERLDQLKLDIEVDRLIELTSAELDREIAEAGFDPEAERAHGPGLRERVVRAIRDRESPAEEPSSGPR